MTRKETTTLLTDEEPKHYEDHKGNSDAYCPECLATLDGFSNIAGPSPRPSSGDLSICYYCKAILVFKNDLTLRRANDVEQNEFKKAMEHERKKTSYGTLRFRYS